MSRAALFPLLLALGGCAGTASTAVTRIGDLGGAGGVYEVTDATRPGDIDRLVAGQSGPVYLWIDVGRSEKLAAEHPEWIAGMGSHEDWRRRLPDAPRPGPGERIGVYPWVSIWYRDVLEARREAIVRLLRGRTRGIAGVFLDHVQGAPSACGCGNDQCRWTVDYRMAGGPEKVDSAPSALLIARLRQDLPEVQWIPVLVTECEERDQPGAASTGYCGEVGCFSGLCWKESTREIEALLRVTDGPIAVLADEAVFGRSEPWMETILRSLEEIPAAHGRPPLPRERVILASARPVRVEDQAPVAVRLQTLGSRPRLFLSGDLKAREAWRPVRIPVVAAPGKAASREEPSHGHP
jgi:hypothetical protein